jgi:transposase
MSDNGMNAPSLEMRDFLAAFDLDRADIKDISIYHENNGLTINITLNIKEHRCPICNTATTKVKGYQNKSIRHSILNPVPCVIHYRARRYICPICGKTFYEDNPFVFESQKISVATVYNVLQELKRPEATFKYVGAKFNLSPSSVANIFDKHIVIERRTLPECISFDETYAFKSDTSDYICVLLDYTDKKIIDVLPSRRKRKLIDYFYNIPLEERNNVKYVSFDMWETYRIVSKLMFPNCVCIVDKFHVLQDLSRRVTRIRVSAMNNTKAIKDKLTEKKNELKTAGKSLTAQEEEELQKATINYYLLKKFNFVLFSNDERITNPNEKKKFNHVLNRYCNLYDIYDLIINIDDNLKKAVEIKDEIHLFYKNTKYKDAKKELEKLIIECRTTNLKELQDFSNTLTNWKQEIINSFIIIPSINRKMNNALIENRNKSIKLLKHSSNGYTNWERFRTRVLYTLNDDIPIKI